VLARFFPDEEMFSNESAARAFIESVRWPNGVIVCPRCGQTGRFYRIQPKGGIREGLYKCGVCRRNFTVTVNSVLEDTKTPLRNWLRAAWMLCSRPEGYSAEALREPLEVTYKTAWSMLQRIQYAMSQEPLLSRLPLSPGRHPRGWVKPHPVAFEVLLDGLTRVVPQRKHPEALGRATGRLEAGRKKRI
jgi:transposase-like protein